MVLKFVAQANFSKPWNKAEEFSEVEEQRGRKNDATLMKESRFGRQCNASLKCINMLESLTAYLEQDKKCQNEVTRLLRSNSHALLFTISSQLRSGFTWLNHSWVSYGN